MGGLVLNWKAGEGVADTDTITLTRDEAAQLDHLIETLEDRLQEASLDAHRLLTAEDRGWLSLTGDNDQVIERETILDVSRVARVMAVADPLIRRAVNLRIAYLGVPQVTAIDDIDDDDQHIQDVVQEFWDSPGNREQLTSAQAFEERERARNTDGNTFHALITRPLTGTVQVRKIPIGQVKDIITDPDDAALPWFYLREWSQKVVEAGHSGTTRTRVETRRRYYPDVDYRPATRPRSIDGIPVEWDKPVVHTAVNRPEGSRWGVPDTLAAIPWARGYKSALEDWARHHKALASIAYTVSAKTRRAASAARAKMPVGTEDATATGSTAGRTAIVGPDSDIAAVSKAGAVLQATAPEPLAGMVAAAMDIPKTMLLADPGSTGARAVAETLDRPLELERLGRRQLETDFLIAVLSHVVREAVRAPRGPLSGTVMRDPDTGLEVVTLAKDQPIAFNIDWPSLDKIDVKTVIESLSIADGLDKIPPLVIARLILVALDVDNVDDVLEAVTDDDGNFIPPSQSAADTFTNAGYDGGGNPQEN